MTTTVKLPNTLEMTLRQHCAITGESISDVIRVALEAHLAAVRGDSETSAWALGAEYFGRHAGPTDLAQTWRDARASLWDDVAVAKTTRGKRAA